MGYYFYVIFIRFIFRGSGSNTYIETLVVGTAEESSQGSFLGENQKESIKIKKIKKSKKSKIKIKKIKNKNSAISDALGGEDTVQPFRVGIKRRRYVN